jgi:hypothetical protein
LPLDTEVPCRTHVWTFLLSVGLSVCSFSTPEFRSFTPLESCTASGGGLKRLSVRSIAERNHLRLRSAFPMSEVGQSPGQSVPSKSKTLQQMTESSLGEQPRRSTVPRCCLQTKACDLSHTVLRARSGRATSVICLGQSGWTEAFLTQGSSLRLVFLPLAKDRLAGCTRPRRRMRQSETLLPNTLALLCRRPQI